MTSQGSEMLYDCNIKIQFQVMLKWTMNIFDKWILVTGGPQKEQFVKINTWKDIYISNYLNILLSWIQFLCNIYLIILSTVFGV